MYDGGCGCPAQIVEPPPEQEIDHAEAQQDNKSQACSGDRLRMLKFLHGSQGKVGESRQHHRHIDEGGETHPFSQPIIGVALPFFEDAVGDTEGEEAGR